MKGRKLYILSIFIIFILIGCGKGEALSTDTLIDKDINNLDINSLNEYKIKVELDEENKSYFGQQWTTYVNNSTEALDEIYFHIYPNAYKSLDTAPILFDQTYDDPITYENGYINMNKVSALEEDLEYSIMGEDETLLNIKLDTPLLPEEKIEIYFEYDVKLPSSKDRFGYGDRTMNFGNWYPIACIYNENGWNLSPYYILGDPFYSDTSNYKVEITTAKDIVVASSGNILTEEVKKDKKIYQIEGKLVRDFAWAASKEFKVREAKVDNTIVKLYYLDNRSSTIKSSLNAGMNSIKIFNEVFGIYPYGQYSIVMTEFPSGMEYPGIVFISNDYFTYSRRDILEQVIVHETAHQWWYGIVGSNQINEAWLDEGLTTYSEVIYTNELYGKEKGEKYFDRNIREGYEYGRRYLGGDHKVNKPLNEFDGWNDYGILVYTKGAMFINEIKEVYGEEALYEILKKYYHEHKFYNATTDDFIRISEEITNDSFEEIVNMWLN